MFLQCGFREKLEANYREYTIFLFSTLNDRTECDLALPWGNMFFPVFRGRNFVGYRRVWRTLATHVRRNGQARRWRTPDDYKNLTKNDFLTKCVRTLFSQVTPVTPRTFFQIADR